MNKPPKSGLYVCPNCKIETEHTSGRCEKCGSDNPDIFFPETKFYEKQKRAKMEDLFEEHTFTQNSFVDSSGKNHWNELLDELSKL